MAKSITGKQINEINKGCSNGFRFDIEDFRMRGDRHLSKTINVTDTELIKATLYFQEEIIEYRETGKKIPVLNVSVWKKRAEDAGAMWSSGLGKFHYYKDKKISRRNIKVLQEITKEVTDDFIQNMAVDNIDKSIF